MFQVTNLPSSYQFSSSTDVACVAARFSDEIVDGSGQVLAHYKASLKDGTSRRRQADFLAGRLCAAEALSRLGSADLFLSPALEPATPPVWPTDFVGSITHTETFAAAVTARRSTIKNLGVDAERILSDEESQEISSLITSSDELERNSLCCLRSGELLSLLFSTKESVYKCLFSMLSPEVSFRDIWIILDRDALRFQFSLSPGRGELPRRGEGSFSIDGTRVYSSVVQRQDGEFL